MQSGSSDSNSSTESCSKSLVLPRSCSSKFKGSTNLVDLPWLVIRQLDQYLRDGSAQMKLLCQLSSSDINVGETIVLMNSSPSAAEQLLQTLGKRGKCVSDLLSYCHHAGLVEPQLVLHRKFEPVEIVKQPQVVEANPDTLLIACLANGFPYPSYQWYCNSEPLPGKTENVLSLRVEQIMEKSTYHCVIFNEVPQNEVWSTFYNRKNKACKSSAASNELQPITIGPSASVQSISQLISKSVNGTSGTSSADSSNSAIQDLSRSPFMPETEDLVAIDKVALIISNCEYFHMGKLRTPSYDATVLAENLIQLGFKTVTLSDLTLREMRSIIIEYCALLGAGVYAVMYFVGHGFEANGQSYLMPVDASELVTSFNQCLCTEEILSLMQEHNPAMSVILLDICRRHETFELPIQDFVRYKPRVNRNTVIGYATSFGEGAYEVLGERNGIFMKYLKRHLQLHKPVAEILTTVMRDLENDIQANRIQFPEIRTNMSKMRSLADPLIFDGHTVTYDLRTYRWQQLHELPEPMRILFSPLEVVILIWFDFYGYFSNMVIIYSSVLPMTTDGSSCSDVSKDYLALLILPEVFESNSIVMGLGEGERLMVKTLVKNLQRLKGKIDVPVQLQERRQKQVISVTKVMLGEILISKLNETGDAS